MMFQKSTMLVMHCKTIVDFSGVQSALESFLALIVLRNMYQSILDECSTSVTHVVMCLEKKSIYLIIWENIQEKSVLFVKCVDRPSIKVLNWKNTKNFTKILDLIRPHQMLFHTGVTFVKNVSHLQTHSETICEDNTLRLCTSVICVTQLSGM